MARASQVAFVTGSKDSAPSPKDPRFSTYTFQTATYYGGGSAPGSPGSKRFRDPEVHLIEPMEPRSPKRYEPLLMKRFFIYGQPIGLFLIGVALEVVAALSKSQQGFPLPNVTLTTLFGSISGQFLASIVPTLVIIPSALLWRELDWILRSYQPFITLHKGNAKAEESILLDYIELGPLFALPRAMKYKHRLIFLSSLTVVLTYFYQPLSSAVLQIRQTPRASPWTAARLETIGLNSNRNDLSPFLAAAGYVDAATLFDFVNSTEFIRDGWVTSRFDFPTNPLINATLSFTTTGIRINPNCSNPVETPVLTRDGDDLTLTSKSIDGCERSVEFRGPVGEMDSGIVSMSCPGDASTLSISQRPVMFWFYRRVGDREDARTVFCSPTLSGTEAEVKSVVSSGRIASVARVSDTVPFNDVLNGENSGRAYNSVVFDPSGDPAITARASAIQLVTTSTIVRRMTQLGGIDAVFAKPNGVLDATTFIYLKHLTLSARAIYFVPAEATIQGEIVAIEARLWVDPFPAHILAACLMFTGIAGIFVHVLSHRQRKRVPLAVQPGSIAATVALTSRSGWGDLLTPYDNILEMEEKLEPLRFRLDKRTGAILADDDVHGDQRMVPDNVSEMRAGLLSHSPNPSLAEDSSTFAAYQAATSYRPRK